MHPYARAVGLGSIHDSFEDAYACTPSQADPRPDVHLDRMLSSAGIHYSTYILFTQVWRLTPTPIQRCCHHQLLLESHRAGVEDASSYSVFIYLVCIVKVWLQGSSLCYGHECKSAAEKSEKAPSTSSSCHLSCDACRALL